MCCRVMLIRHLQCAVSQGGTQDGFRPLCGSMQGQVARGTVRGVSTTMKMCIQADLDTAGAIRHMNKNKSERAVCSLHPPAPGSPSFFFDTEWVMSTCEHHGTRAEITCCRLV